MEDIKDLASRIANSVYEADNDGESYYSDEDVMEFNFQGYLFAVIVSEGSSIGSGYFALQDGDGNYDEAWDDNAPYYRFESEEEVLTALQFIRSNGFAPYDR